MSQSRELFAKPSLPLLMLLVGMGAWSAYATYMNVFNTVELLNDFPTHIKKVEELLQGEITIAYPMFHALVALLHPIASTKAGTVIVLAFCDAISAYLAFSVLIKETNSKWLAAALTAGVLISSPVALFTFPNLYGGYYSGAIYHNPTMLVMKPLALLLFMVIHQVYFRKIPEKIGFPTLLLLTRLTFITTLAKPNFTIIIIPAVFLMGLLFGLKQPYRKTTIAVCAAIGSTVFLLWIQNKIVYVPGSTSGGVIFAPLAVVLHFEPNVLLFIFKTIMSFLFPLTVLIYNFRAVREDRFCVMAWICFLIGLFYHFMLAESGERMYHGNFGAGLMFSEFLIFLASARLLLREDFLGNSRFRRIPQGALVCHVLSGILWYATQTTNLAEQCAGTYRNSCW